MENYTDLNFSLKDSNIFFERLLHDLVDPFLDRKEIIGIRGPRQTGKTTLLKRIQEEFQAKGNQTHFLNLDSINTRTVFMENPLSIILRYKNPSSKLFLFIDEIQRATNAGESLKLIYDEYPDVKIIFSGSSSLEIREKVLPPLVGRLILFDLLSFDFGEFIGAFDQGLKRYLGKKRQEILSILDLITSDDVKTSEKKSNKLKELITNLEKHSFINEMTSLMKTYLIWGGYPEIIKILIKESKGSSSDEPQLSIKNVILQNIINLYLEKDIIMHFKIEHSNKFLSLCKIAGAALGGLLVNSDLASTLRIAEPTVQKYLSVLEHSFIVKLITPYHKNIKSELRKRRKIYFLDNGIRNALLDNFTPFDKRGGTERGYLLENFVFRQLLTNFTSNYKNWKLYYWRTQGKAEVDFILKKGEILMPIEVKLGGKKVNRGFYSFLETYKPTLAFVATLDVFKVEYKLGIPIIWLPAYYF